MCCLRSSTTVQTGGCRKAVLYPCAGKRSVRSSQSALVGSVPCLRLAHSELHAVMTKLVQFRANALRRSLCSQMAEKPWRGS